MTHGTILDGQTFALASVTGGILRKEAEHAPVVSLEGIARERI